MAGAATACDLRHLSVLDCGVPPLNPDPGRGAAHHDSEPHQHWPTGPSTSPSADEDPDRDGDADESAPSLVMADAPQLVVIIGSTMLARRGLGYDLARTVAARPVLLSLDELRLEVGSAAFPDRLEREVDVNLRNGRSVIIDRLDPTADRQMLIALAARHDVLDVVVLVPVDHPTADPLVDLAAALPAEGWGAVALLPPAVAQVDIPLEDGEEPC